MTRCSPAAAASATGPPAGRPGIGSPPQHRRLQLGHLSQAAGRHGQQCRQLHGCCRRGCCFARVAPYCACRRL
eukprot:15470755-Alexandrium_andersonii.AAC.1